MTDGPHALNEGGVKPYVPVPVAIARQVALLFDKSIVVIIAVDPVHAVTHTTTYGVNSEDKVVAARLGEVLAVAAGSDITQARKHEDFRDITAAESRSHAERADRDVRLFSVILDQISRNVLLDPAASAREVLAQVARHHAADAAADARKK